jgi:hypothetical protein
MIQDLLFPAFEDGSKLKGEDKETSKGRDRLLLHTCDQRDKLTCCPPPNYSCA